MKRVHRNLAREEVEALRDQLATQISPEAVSIPDALRTMRLIARKSQHEYARMCDVAPRVLADVEAGRGHPRVDTLEKLLRPFGFRVGVVASPSVELQLKRMAAKYDVPLATTDEPAGQKPAMRRRRTTANR